MYTKILEIIGFTVSAILSCFFPQYILAIVPLIIGAMILYQKARGCTCFPPNKKYGRCPYHSYLYAKEEVRCAAKLGGRSAVTSLLTSSDEYCRSAARKFLKKHPLNQRKRK